MKITKSELSRVIKEILKEELDEIEEDEVEEGLAGGLAGAALAQGDVLKMAAGGYFGSKVQDYINKNLKKKDNESE